MTTHDTASDRPNRRVAGRLAVGLIALAFAVTLFWQNQALRAMQKQLSPAIVGIVDLDRVLQETPVKDQADQQLMNVRQPLLDEIKRRQQEITALNEDIESGVLVGQALRDAQAKVLQLTFELQGYTTWVDDQIEYEKARAWAEIYDRIKAGTDRLARREGYDLVLVNDSINSPQGRTELDLLEEISARRLLFAHERIDVTDGLIEVLLAP